VAAPCDLPGCAARARSAGGAVADDNPGVDAAVALSIVAAAGDFTQFRAP